MTLHKALLSVFLATSASTIAASFLRSDSEGVRCKGDDDCPTGTYCYYSGLCAACTNCSVYSRQKGGTACARDPQQCGPCFPGYKAEEFTGAEVHYYCRKVDEQPMETESMLWMYYVGVPALLLVVVLIIIYAFRRLKVMSGIKSELRHCFQPSAPPDMTVASHDGDVGCKDVNWIEDESGASGSSTPYMKVKTLSEHNYEQELSHDTPQGSRMVRPPDYQFFFQDQSPHHPDFGSASVRFTNNQGEVNESSPFLSIVPNRSTILAITAGSDDANISGAGVRAGSAASQEDEDVRSSRRFMGQEESNSSSSNRASCGINLNVNNYFTQSM